MVGGGSEWENHLFDRAMMWLRGRVEEKHFQAFDLYPVRGWPVGEVARGLGYSRGRVYLIKHRLAGLLKQELQRLRASEPD